MRTIVDAILGDMLAVPTRRLVLSISGPSVMEWLAYWEGQPLSIRLTVWGVWIVLVYLATSFAHSQWEVSSSRRRTALSADLRAFMNELSALANSRFPGDREREHSELRDRIYQRVLLYDESMAHEFMGVQERQSFPACLQDEIGKLVSFQITARPRA
jgi:hypothetical protein